MRPYTISFAKFLFNILLIIHFSHANWGTPGSSQYHIQTDEGPDRFFKYQTDNGQFRKERRLQDGTVIGTNAWIDGLGYLRMNDYIADHAGYRIMNSKTVFVGKDRPIEEAMKEAKSSSSGVHLSTTRKPSTYYVQTTTARPVSQAIPYSTPGYYHNKVPTVVIRPHSQAREDYPSLSNFNDLNHNVVSYPTNDFSNLQKPSIYYQPPLEESPKIHDNSLPPIIVLPTSTPVTIIENESHLPPIVIHPSSTPSTLNDVSDSKDESDLPPLAYYPSSTVKPVVKDESNLPPIAFYPSSTERPLDFNNVVPLSSTSAPNTFKDVANELLPPRNGDDSYDAVIPITSRPRNRYRPSSYHHESSTERTIVEYDRNNIDAAASFIAPTYQNNPNNVPLFDRSKYQQTYGNYDGVGVTANGFRYYLPRQYQEEVENKGEDSRDGSYGYIDPFGIRRVVYYNAGKNGFIHRKNNRYVGFNATPFDPRPN